ncbi:MAG: hypothetical protein LBT81_04195 [Helicobacteraceae bacterium]|jgi:hypothetical protein|nr:hypothetical protein [Helicobacteraceae bacterium]
MKKLKIAALLAALALFGIGCGEGGGSSGSAIKGSGNKGVSVGQDGFTDDTKFVDENGNQVDRIGDIQSDGTGEVPPRAPSFVRPANIPEVPVPPAAG